MTIHPLPVDRVPADGTALLDRIRAGDPDALDEAMRRFWGPLLRYSVGIAPHGDAAEDAVQEAFIRLWGNRARWKSSDSLRGLLFRVVRNELLNRKRSRRRRASWLDRLARRPCRRPHTPEEVFEESDLTRAAEAAIGQLPERRREAFVLVRQVGLSYREAAEVMGVSPQTVANQMSAALASLRDDLAAFLTSEEKDPTPLGRGRGTG